MELENLQFRTGMVIQTLTENKMYCGHTVNINQGCMVVCAWVGTQFCRIAQPCGADEDV